MEVFQEKVLYNTYYKDVLAFREASIQFFRNIGDHYDEIGRLMRGEFDLA